MKKINLKGISKVLSEKELKNVAGGTSGGCDTRQSCGGSCTAVGKSGTCYAFSFGCSCYT